MWFLALACTPQDTDAVDERPWAEPGARGPYDAGVTTLSVTDDRGKPLTIEVWYPAFAPEGDTPDAYGGFPYTREAYRDIAAEPGPWPLVAFSHGNSGIRFQSVFLTEHLAQHGFVVVAPDHTHNTFLDYDADQTIDVMLERPGDVSSAVDAIVAASASDPMLAGLLDGDDYAVVGHSFGGWTAMAVGGGVVTRDFYADHCATSPSALCGLVGDVPEDAVLPAPDPRAKVTLPMTPCGWYTFGDAGLADLVPSLYLGGALDPICPMATEVDPAFDRSPSPSALATLPLAGHFAFSDLCVFAPFLSDECDEQAAGYGVIAEEQADVQVLVTAWLGATFVGDARYAPWLEADRPAAFAWETR